VDRVISIELFGKAYTFRADAEAFHAEKIANYLVEHVEKARACAEVPGKLDTLILAALNIANDYFEMKQRREELVKDIDRRCKALIDNIDANP
jgi:cell division protein ZapA